MSFQVYIIEGRLTRDVKIRDVGQTQVANFAVATSRKYKDKNGTLVEEVLFMDTAVWGAQAKPCAEYLSKGSPVLVQGYLKTEEYNDASTGAPKVKYVLNADKVVFLGSKKDDRDTQAPMPFGKANAQPKSADPETGQIDLSDMGLPF